MSTNGARVEVEDPTVRFRIDEGPITAVDGLRDAAEPCSEQYR